MDRLGVANTAPKEIVAVR